MTQVVWGGSDSAFVTSDTDMAGQQHSVSASYLNQSLDTFGAHNRISKEYFTAPTPIPWQHERSYATISGWNSSVSILHTKGFHELVKENALNRIPET